MADRMRRRRSGPADEGPEAASNARRRRRGAAPEPRRRRRRGPSKRDEVEQVDDQVTPGTENIEDRQTSAPPQPERPAPDRSTAVATEVTLPELGESVTEGTITAWLVEVGQPVEVDQPLFELSSDKIDTEVPAPASGVLTEIKVGVDETVDVGTVVAVIGAADEQAAQPETPPQPEPEPAQPQASSTEPAPDVHERPGGDYERGDEQVSQPTPDGDGGEGQLMSPLVRRMASEHNLDATRIRGTGEGGRVTREDVEAAISTQGTPAEPEVRAREAEQRETEQRVAERARTQPQRAPQPERTVALRAGPREHLEDLSRIRQRIAAKMMESMQSSAQLTTVQEADVTRIMRLRETHKDAFKAREGVSLSPFVFLARAAVLAIRRHPTVNAQADWDAGKVKYHDYVNLGIAVDTDKGLIVPNVKSSDDLTLAALARAISEAAAKARGQAKLEMQDIEGGTFTVTNTGSRGVLIDTPILNYPEVGILATGVIQKRPVVIEDEGAPAIAIRDMVYLCLTYDHRLLDGADAARYVTDVKEVIETHDWAGELG